MALQFGVHPNVVFEHAPLTAVICQVRFSPILSLLTEAGATGFQTIIRDEYPRFEKDLQANVAISDDAVKVERRAPAFRFTSENDAWRASLAADFVSLETPSYTNFEEFLARTTVLLDAAHRTLLPGPSLRVGLRKVNEMHVNPGTHESLWREIVNPELLGAVGHQGFDVGPNFSYGELRFPDDDNLLIVRHGLHPEKADTYLLDQDYYTERPYEVNSAQEITALLQHFSDGMTNFFHWALTEPYKATLGPRAREAVRAGA